MIQNQRLPYVDVAKGIAIWLMIVGHQYINEQTAIYINSFHIPLFFFISGMFFRKEKPFFQNLESAIRSLLIPYVYFSLINLSICWISPYVHPELYFNMTGIDIFKAAINGIFIGVDRVTPISFLPLGPLWFLMALFVIRVYCSAMSSMIKRDLLWALASIVVSITLFFILLTDVYSMKYGMMAVPFFIAGYLMRKVDYIHLNYKPLILLLLLLYFIFIVPLNGMCGSLGGHYGNSMIVYYFNALVGILMALLLSTYITCKNGYIQKVGRNTLVILGMHAFFIRAAQIISVSLFGTNSMNSIIYIIIVPIIAIVCCIFISPYISKYIPSAVGKRL